VTRASIHSEVLGPKRIITLESDVNWHIGEQGVTDIFPEITHDSDSLMRSFEGTNQPKNTKPATMGGPRSNVSCDDRQKALAKARATTLFARSSVTLR
jgi:hypothetical protein